MLYDPQRRYLKDAACTDPDDRRLFFVRNSAASKRPPEKTQALWDRAKEICGICPVMQQCRRDTLGEMDGVWGGLDPHQRFRIRQALPAAVKRWPRERQLRWGEELNRLRESGKVFRDIQRVTGIPEAPAIYLISQWQRHQADAETQEPAEVVELAAVELEPGAASRKTPFPEVAGQRHLWARNNGIVQDCWYRGQTADGLWIHVLIDGRGRRYSSFKWIPAEDVWMYYPQPVVLKEFASRPDSVRPEDEYCREGHAYDEANTYVRPDNGKRVCRACKNATRRRKAA